MDVLVYLSRHQNKVLSKERLIQAIWPDTSVTDEVLTNAISELRKAFGENARNSHHIQTFPRRGYRLKAPVSFLKKNSSSDGSRIEERGFRRVASSPWWRTGIVVSAAVIVISALLIFVQKTSAPDGGFPSSLAVLPLVNISGDPDVDYLSDGIAAGISASLSQLSELRVLPSSSLYRFREEGKGLEAQLVGQELQVDAILAGTLHRLNDHVAVRVELVDISESSIIWGAEYTYEFGEIIAMQGQITQEIVQALRLELSENEHVSLTRRPTTNAAAYDAYQKGCYFLEYSRFHRDGTKNLGKAISYLDEAITLDPAFGLAYVKKAEVLNKRAFSLTSKEDYEISRTLVEKAVLVDEDLAEAHKLRALKLAYHDHDWQKAEREMKRAQELNPNLLPSSSYLLWLGRRAEAIRAIERKLKLSDPHSSDAQSLVAFDFYMAREFDRAVESVDAAIELDPSASPSYIKGWCLEAKGMYKEAAETALEGCERWGGASPERLAALKAAFADSGWVGLRRLELEIQKKLEGGPLGKPYDIAAGYARIGDKDEAFKWLNRAFELPVGAPVPTDARFDPIRTDPRYEEFLIKMKLPEEIIARHLASVKKSP
jgi:TolB-like protein